MGFRKLNGLNCGGGVIKAPKILIGALTTECCVVIYIYIYIHIEKKNCFSNFLQIEAQASGCTWPASDV